MKKQVRQLMSLFFSLLLLFMLCACDAPKTVTDSMSEFTNTVMQSKGESLGFDNTINPESKPPQTTDFADIPNIPVNMSEKIIYSANISIETTEFDQVLQDITGLMKDFGGFIESSNVNGSTAYNTDGSLSVIRRYGSYALRIPAKDLNEFLAAAGSLGNIVSKSQNAENITARFQDCEARKLALLTQETRLIELLAKAENIEAIIALESKLSEIRYEIESLESQLRNWQMQVDYSTVYISLQEVEKYTPTVMGQRTFYEKIRNAVSDSLSAFGQNIQNFMINTIYFLPTLIILLIGLWVIYRLTIGIIRRKQKRVNLLSKDKTQTQNEAQNSEDKQK